MQLFRAETDVPAGISREGPQGVVDRFLRPQDSDILVAFFWRRLGTPVMDAQSGTEHEIRCAWEAWQQTGKPEIMVYFNRASFTPSPPEEDGQTRRLLEFKEQLSQMGIYRQEYDGVDQFRALVRSDLMKHALAHVRRGRSVQTSMAEQEGRIRCFVAAEPRIVRLGGRAELLGDIFLTFKLGPGPMIERGIQQFDVRTTLNAPIGNRLDANRLADAVLAVLPGAPGWPPSPHCVRAAPVAHNTVVFERVPIDLTSDVRTVLLTVQTVASRNDFCGLKPAAAG